MVRKEEEEEEFGGSSFVVTESTLQSLQCDCGRKPSLEQRTILTQREKYGMVLKKIIIVLVQAAIRLVSRFDG